MEATCQHCGSTFETRSHRAKWCSERCRKRRERAGGGTFADVVAMPPPKEGVERATTAELERLGVASTPYGAAAIALARRIDRGDYADTGSALAALVKEWRATMAALRDAGSREADVLDELRARRERKRQ